MRMDKQGKGGSNAVDEEQKAASARNGRQSAPSTRLPLGECTRVRQKAQSASTNVKANAPTVPLSPLHHNKRNNRQGNQGEYRG